jgi:O6-methylguanine-DNA--protein-cysteine methyltransferase
MAGQRIPALYGWSWRIGELRIYAASSDKGALRVCLSLKDEAKGFAYFKAPVLADHFEENRTKNSALISSVEAALRNRPVPRGIPMDILATPFQWKAWKTIAGIPFGETRSYGEVAAVMGKAGASRAVGQAMGRNPLPLIFP